MVSVEQVRYDEYIKSISASLLNILNVTPLNGQAIFEVDFGMLFSMLDRLLGGTGDAGKISRDLTDIEKVLAENIVHLALTDMKNAWENITPSISNWRRWTRPRSSCRSCRATTPWC